MRRKDRQITDSGQLETILRHAQCLRLGLVDHGLAYIVPMSFGMANGGRRCALSCISTARRKAGKIDLIEAAGIASFEADTDIRIIEADQACAVFQCLSKRDGTRDHRSAARCR